MGRAALVATGALLAQKLFVWNDALPFTVASPGSILTLSTLDQIDGGASWREYTCVYARAVVLQVNTFVSPAFGIRWADQFAASWIVKRFDAGANASRRIATRTRFIAGGITAYAVDAPTSVALITH